MTELKKNYNPKDIEDQWYSLWEEKGYFKPDFDAPRSPFCIVIPPPNVTGSLHMGHALNSTVQDILTRWKRMLGHKTLWLPGMDHAGIATQNVVERELKKEGLSRYEVGRESFIERVWEWKQEYGGRIINQLKKLGASCDWSRERFTLDEGLSKAVREVFVRLFEEGIIYRDNRLINWCPRCHTALSDLEVEYEELEGKLYYITYPLADGDGSVTVATTRPETMLGDTAVAVHPDDERYKKYRGKQLALPLTGRTIPVIADPAVDPQFGTGAVKVTPAHDFNDEAMGRRHKLPSISVINEDGRMSKEAGERYAGLDRYECRKRVLEDLAAQNLLEGERKNPHSVGHCYRCKTIIEPLTTIQWYVKVESLASEAIKAVENGSIRLIPETWENNYFGWMRDIRDWCISRQIWWGHRIPVWYCPECKNDKGVLQGELIEHTFFKPVTMPNGSIITGGTYAQLRALGLSHAEILKNSKTIRVSREVTPLCRRDGLTQCPTCGSTAVIRDPDVLDTWFSSALWPFSTLGWPDKTRDLETFYPTSVLVTAFDILFFWVARMIMMGLKFMGDVPFRDVYIHALIRDQKGEKMSKSKGNVIDPLIMIDRYGADAFRFSLAAFAAQGRDIRFSEERVEGYRHFINKLWNATKFITAATKEEVTQPVTPNPEGLNLASRWILSRLASAVDEVNRNLSNYRFNDAANAVYQFIWHEFCDWYIELSKPVIYRTEDDREKQEVINCLLYTLKETLKLLHPFTPFVTEELWHTVFKEQTSIMVAPYPETLARYSDAEEEMSAVLDAITGIRSIRGELNISPSVELTVQIKALSGEVERVLSGNTEAILKLTRSKTLTIGQDVSRVKGSAVSVRQDMEIYVPIEGLLDTKAEISRLTKERAKVDESIMFLNKKLLNEDFLKSAPKEVIAKDKAKYDALIEKKTKIEDNLKLLETINA